MISPDKQFVLRSAGGHAITVSLFGDVPYHESFASMSAFANDRSKNDLDQIWVLQHPKVYTQGTACSLDAFLPSDIPIIKTDRGGQITYHGPGQIVMYPLLNLRRHNIGVKSLVSKLEQCMIDTLCELNIRAQRHENAPGVYVNGAKIGALGLRIRKGNSYHGLSLNVDVDLAPFSNIDPCGYKGLQVTNIVEQTDLKVNLSRISKSLLNNFLAQL